MSLITTADDSTLTLTAEELPLWERAVAKCMAESEDAARAVEFADQMIMALRREKGASEDDVTK